MARYSQVTSQVLGCVSSVLVGVLYSVVRPIPWYYGNPVFSRVMVNINTSKCARLFTIINEHKKCGESRYPFVYSNDKYFNPRQVS